ncbi:cryptochrome/photolyase family protein [uncultured Amnibacterium sp.]|uniref:cryptochrome/photolyase family protein n=1 Tax=uncultured Amnibacterium sp. TaxID=1631851 RepID=UPI0035CB587F
MSDNTPGAAVVWLRDDLRVSDNPALAAAARAGLPTVAVYVLDDTETVSRRLGGASRWWLHHSLAALAASLEKRGTSLVLRRGDAAEQVVAVLRDTRATHLYLNRRYPAPERQQDEQVAAAAAALGVQTVSSAAQLLTEPGKVVNADGRMFGVFTPFWRAAQRLGEPRQPHPAPSSIRGGLTVRSEPLESLGLLPLRPDWAAGLRETWTPGEKGAHRRLDAFVHARLQHYADGRDEPAAEASSRLSPHLKFGELSPHQVWHRVHTAQAVPQAVREKFLTELGWREFNWHLLANHAQLATENVHHQFDSFPWAEVQPDTLAAWQQGRTGVPLVDAGMRQLWHTGWMHNRVRMVVASFLIKNLRYDWRLGEQWFWDCLVDADAGNNPAQWQWTAGSGADAAPYFRVFNPVTQAQKFDPAGEYVHQWVPELRDVQGPALFEPWLHGSMAGYPDPIVDLKESRRQALAAFEQMRRAPQLVE